MRYTTIALLSFAFIMITDVVARINSFIGASNGSTLLILVLHVLTIVGFLMTASRFRWRDKMPREALLIFKLMMLWNLMGLARGLLNAANYWDWKYLMLGYFFSIMVPMSIATGINFQSSAKTLPFILRRVFLLGFIFIPLTLSYDTEMYSRVMMAASLFILFMPYLKFRWCMLILLVAATSVIMDFSYRVNVLRIALSTGLLGMYFCRHWFGKPILNFATGLAFALPLLFLYLGATDQFNIFRDSLTTDYAVTVVEGGRIRESGIAADTRTFLYQEVFHSMSKRGSSFLIGEGGSAGYESEFFADAALLTKKGRTASEVGFLNIVMYSGAIGVTLYAAMLFMAAFYAINRSNNYICKMLGMFLAAHWVIFFIEDITKLDMNYYFIWFTVGLCLSHQFRALTDEQIRYFFRFQRRTALLMRPNNLGRPHSVIN